jgi:DNA-binding GntR family transcriptional regulator
VENKPVLNIKSLKEQVYEYLREQMRIGAILPGSVIDMEETSKKLGVSKTPLRDALLQLEMEGFVSILPPPESRRQCPDHPGHQELL